MPKGFSEREKEIIRTKLIEAGKNCFGAYGIKKTNIEDLTRAAGISKGAFYLFFSSKEELFFEILEQFESEFRQEVIANVDLDRQSPREGLQKMLLNAFSVWKANPIFGKLDREEYAALLRKLPEEAVQDHLQSDHVFVTAMLAKWNEEGIRVERDPSLVTGLMMSLFYVSLHEEEFAPSVYEKTMQVLIEIVTNYLLE